MKRLFRRKVLFLSFTVLVVLLVGGGVTVFMLYFRPYWATEPPGELLVREGGVALNTGHGWVDVGPGTRLTQGAMIRAEGWAELSLSRYSVIRLTGAEVHIKALNDDKGLVALEQLSGDVWYTLTPASRVTAFTVDTPAGSFTAVGTSFGVSVGSHIVKVVVDRGAVVGLRKARLGEWPEPVEVPFLIEAGHMALVQGEEEGAPLEELEEDEGSLGIWMGAEVKIRLAQESTWLRENRQADDRWILLQRNYLKRKYASFITVAKAMVQRIMGQVVTDEMVDDFIDRYLRGEIDIGRLIQDGTIPPQYIPLLPPEFKPFRSSELLEFADSLRRLSPEEIEGFALWGAMEAAAAGQAGAGGIRPQVREGCKCLKAEVCLRALKSRAKGDYGHAWICIRKLVQCADGVYVQVFCYGLAPGPEGRKFDIIRKTGLIYEDYGHATQWKDGDPNAVTDKSNYDCQWCEPTSCSKAEELIAKFEKEKKGGKEEKRTKYNVLIYNCVAWAYEQFWKATNKEETAPGSWVLGPPLSWFGEILVVSPTTPSEACKAIEEAKKKAKEEKSLRGRSLIGSPSIED